MTSRNGTDKTIIRLPSNRPFINPIELDRYSLDYRLDKFSAAASTISSAHNTIPLTMKYRNVGAVHSEVVEKGPKSGRSR